MTKLENISVCLYVCEKIFGNVRLIACDCQCAKDLRCDNEQYLYSDEPECFDSEAEALAFCAGIGQGIDERASVERYPLRSCEPDDVPFIEAIENY